MPWFSGNYNFPICKRGGPCPWVHSLQVGQVGEPDAALGAIYSSFCSCPCMVLGSPWELSSPTAETRGSCLSSWPHDALPRQRSPRGAACCTSAHGPSPGQPGPSSECGSRSAAWRRALSGCSRSRCHRLPPWRGGGTALNQLELSGLHPRIQVVC